MKTYLITDLCYIKHTDKYWEKVCESDSEDIKVFKGLKVLRNSFTPHGDGRYSVNEFGWGGVDSGTLALLEVTKNFKHINCSVLITGKTEAEARKLYTKALRQL